MQELEDRVTDIEDDMGDLEDRVDRLKKRSRKRKGGKKRKKGEKLRVKAVRRVYIHHNLREEDGGRDPAAVRSRRIFRAVEPRIYLRRRRESYTARPDDLDEGYVPRRRSIPRPHFLDLLGVHHVHPLPHPQPHLPISQTPTANLNLDLPAIPLTAQQQVEEPQDEHEYDHHPYLWIHPVTGLPDSRGATPGPLLESEVRRRGAYVYSRPGDAHYAFPEHEREREEEGVVGTDILSVAGGGAGDESGAGDVYHLHPHPHHREEEAPDYFPSTPYTQTNPLTTRSLQDTAATTYSTPTSADPTSTSTSIFPTSTSTTATHPTTAPTPRPHHPSSASTHHPSLFRQEMLKRESSTEAVYAHGEIFRDGEGSGNRRRGGEGEGFSLDGNGVFFEVMGGLHGEERERERGEV
jgi:hypothetical protein